MTELDEKIRFGLAQLAEGIEPQHDPGEALSRPVEDERLPRRRLALVAAVMVGLVVVASVVTWRASDRESVIGTTGTPGATAEPSGTTGVPPTSVTIGLPEPAVPGSLPPGWRALPPGPFEKLSPLAVIASDSQFIVWRAAKGDGSGRDRSAEAQRSAVFDLATESWRELPPDPMGDFPGALDIVAGGGFVGAEAVFWSGGRIAAWNPATSSWRLLAPPPRALEHEGIVAGDVVVFPFDGLLFRPATNRWTEIARPSPGLIRSTNPDAHGTTYVDGLVVIVGRATGIYDIARGMWRELELPPINPSYVRGSPNIVGWDGWTVTTFPYRNQVVAIDGAGNGAILDVRAAAWVREPGAVAAPPIAPCEPAPMVVRPTDAQVIASNCGVTARFDGASWTVVEVPSAERFVAIGGRVLAYSSWNGAALAIYELAG